MLRRLLPPIAVLLVPFALVFGIWAGGHPEVLPGFMRDTLVDDSDGQVYEEAVDIIARDYFRDVDRDRLLDASIQAAVGELRKRFEDPFSHYFDPKAYRRFHEATSGEFEGIGMTVQDHPRGLKVLTVFEDGPAERAGLERDDVITEANGTSLRGKTSEQSTALIKGPAGTKVRLTVRSGKRRRSITVERASISVPVVDSRMVRKGGHRIAYASLASFTSGAHGELARALRPLLRRDADGVVLDLRNNGGGLLQEGVLVASLFVSDGVIVTTRGRSRPSKSYKASGQAVDTEIPLVVLVNQDTASASEIVAGALKDRDRATVVGTRTYGKGVFQEVQPLPNGGALDITVGEYFTPKGRNLAPADGKPGGIPPDVRAQDDADTRPDEALQRALSVLAGKIE